MSSESIMRSLLRCYGSWENVEHYGTYTLFGHAGLGKIFAWVSKVGHGKRFVALEKLHLTQLF